MRFLLAGLSTRAIAESAVRAGFDVATVDYFGDLDTKRLGSNTSLREQGLGYSATALARVAREVPYDAVAYCGGLENHPEAVEALAEGRELLGNGPETLRSVRDPATLFPFLASRGFAVPQTIIFAQSAPGLPTTGRWLVKPIASGGGHGIHTWRGQPPGPRQILQQHLAGIPASAAFVADGRHAVLLGLSEQLHGPSGFRYRGNVLPLQAPAGTVEELRHLIDALTSRFGLVGLNGVDFVLQGSRPVVVEVNPRYSASMELVERATGVAMFALHVAACRGSLPTSRVADAALRAVTSSGFHGKAIVYARRSVAITASHSWMEHGVRDVPHPGDVIGKGRPICTVLAEGPSRGACLDALGVAEAEIVATCVSSSREPGQADEP